MKSPVTSDSEVRTVNASLWSPSDDNRSMWRPERANRPATPTPRTNKANLCRDRNGDKSGTRGNVAGEVGLLEAIRRDAMLMELQKQRKKARREEKQYDCAIDRILRLQQKDYESPNTYGKRASKLRAIVDEDDERWVVKQFINGIERKEFRRSLRVD